MTALIEITFSNDLFTANAVSYLGSAFADYNAACRTHGFTWNRERGRDSRNVGTIDGLPAFVLDLFAANISVRLDAGSEQALANAAAKDAVEDTVLDTLLADIEIDGSPYTFQREGIDFLRKRDHALLGDDMGLGKTVQVLLALDPAAEMAGANIMVPASILLKWARESRRWRPDLDVTIVLKSATKRLRAELGERGIAVIDSMRWAQPHEIVLCNYESMGSSYFVIKGERGQAIYREAFDGDKRDLIIERTMDEKPLDGHVLVGDEIHRCKNPKAKVTRKWRGLLKDTSRAWGLSGTPLFNRPPDLWNVLQDLNLSRVVFSGYNDFVKRMGGQRGRYGMEWSGNVDASVGTSLRRVMLRRMRDDVLDLPMWTYETIDVSLNDTQKKFLDKVAERTSALDIDLTGLDEAEAERAINKALATAHTEIGFEDFSRVRKIIADASLLPAIEIISEYEDAERPLFVATAHRAPVEAIAQREGWAAIYGDTSKVDRDRVQEQFLAGHLRGVVGTIAACKEGLDLYAADTVLFIDYSWNPSDNEQTASRIRRIGQQADSCTQASMQADHPLVERMIELLTWKARMHAATLDGATTRTSRVAEDANEAARALDTYRSRKPAERTSERVSAFDTSVIKSIPAPQYRGAIHNESGNEISFWQIDRPTEGRWAGWAFIKQQVGPSLNRAGCIRPDGSQAGLTGPAMRALKIIAKDPEAAAVLYGKELGVCAMCGKTLTNDESRERGIGPICAGKAGW
jgi:hypothetical protein